MVLYCLIKERQPDIERVQALADMSRSALCCHSDETRAPVANPPNCEQLDGTPYHSPNLHPDPCSIVGMWQGTDKRDTQTAVTNIHFASATPHAKCTIANFVIMKEYVIYCELYISQNRNEVIQLDDSRVPEDVDCNDGMNLQQRWFVIR